MWNLFGVVFGLAMSIPLDRPNPLSHSMAKDNFNKSKETTPTTSTALKVAP